MSGRQVDRGRLADVVLAAVVGALGTAVAAFDDGTTALDHALVALASAALAFHRAAPRAVLAVVTALGTAYVVHAHPGPLSALPVLGAVHTAARVGHRGVAAAGGAVFLAGYVAAGPGTQHVAERAGLLAGWFLCAVVTGLADRNWQAYLRQTEQRALEAERTREEAALRRAGEERLRIARELHDSLTHSISIVKLQAGVAVHLARKRGDEVPPALLAIQEASGEAMRELRSALQVLRADEPAGTPALLVERARAAGLAVDLTVTGDERPLPRAVDLAAYRIVQEALTNAARHAGPAKVRVRIDYGTGNTGAPVRELAIDVDDDGAADPARPPVPGTGLTGMRERVGALGGTLSAAPRAEGGFAVRARLPLGETI
ncbi:sensor histidine kinase [Streptomyces sp. CCM_MD2014]|uniref:sensor histidine kinase n=1 Tax=Streptomyces sp. CCM_MD2014 TaxID=1561022 RepID=UPI00052A823C|nr:sensor histidine kinase [Streptomyces sp. CCM_MD2014]AIV33173.1 histidine kinase [Streptomyces sp. CCM_MD2014]MDA4889891.1 sensor histidine kinase [Streptomyces sp. MS2A]